MQNNSLRWSASAFLALAAILVSCNDDPDSNVLSGKDPYDIVAHMKPGGETATTTLSSGLAFGEPVEGLTDVEMFRHNHGDRLFETTFVPKGNPLQAGLGPLYNNNSCINCHQKEGRAPFPANLNARSGFFLRVSSGNDELYGPIGTPGFGGQLQQLAVRGRKPEVQFGVRYEDRTITYGDGTKMHLKRPVFYVYDTYIPMPSDAMFSPRIGMPVFGLGLLEAIPEETILAYADPDDLDGDEISGRPNYVFNHETGKRELGRFGWKANTASVKDQSAQAFVNDMGLTNPIYKKEPHSDQINGDPYDESLPTEISEIELEAVAFYARTLCVPAPRGLDKPIVKRGAQLFTDLGCAKCHVPTMKTGKSDIAALSEQTIYAYTDMLLHDMGADLADNRPDHGASGTEWKTRPLWGIGLTYTVNGYEFYLHDGRAKSIEEAILWHGGEAETIRNKFINSSKQDRDALLTFLHAL